MPASAPTNNVEIWNHTSLDGWASSDFKKQASRSEPIDKGADTIKRGETKVEGMTEERERESLRRHRLPGDLLCGS